MVSKLLRSWSNDQTVIAMSSGEAELCAAFMAIQQAMGTEKHGARAGSTHHQSRELQVDASAAIETIVLAGTGYFDLSYVLLQLCEEHKSPSGKYCRKTTWQISGRRHLRRAQLVDT